MTSSASPARPDTERAGVVIPFLSLADQPSERREEETRGLIEALGCACVFLRSEFVRQPNAALLLQGGMVSRLAEDLEAQGCNLCVIDGALTPVQQRNLEDRLGVKVIDRTGLILEIFGLRARTREGVLQVELARILYERSRLVRTWTHLERQRGGRGFLSGPGETQLEADRRMLDTTIRRLREALDSVRRTRRLQRAGRRKRDVPVIALVGYTNAGKSTLFNRLTGAGVLARDMPFATLDPTIRAYELADGREAALVDTVGFIGDLPVHLVESFRATLEEVLDADVLVHVRDRSDPDDLRQREDVMSVLQQLEADQRTPLPPIIEAWNKIDLLDNDSRETLTMASRISELPTIEVSARTGEGLDKLQAMITEALSPPRFTFTVALDAADGEALAWLHAHAIVGEVGSASDGSLSVRARLDRETEGRFRAKFPDLTLEPGFIDRAP